MTAGKPTGGKWTYDDQNRKKIPKSLEPPELVRFKHTKHTKNILSIVESTFKSHPGEHNNFNHPTTRKQALDNLDFFINEKFKYARLEIRKKKL